jgi:hypothetical protein
LSPFQGLGDIPKSSPSALPLTYRVFVGKAAVWWNVLGQLSGMLIEKPTFRNGLLHQLSR